MKKSPAWRSAVAVQIVLIAAIAAAVFMGIYGVISSQKSGSDETTAAQQHDSGDNSETAAPKPEPFTAAAAGCLLYTSDAADEATIV